MIVVIDGWWGSGKSVMRGLLDGHPNLFVCPVQDSIISAFARDWETRPWMRYRDTEQLRKLLASLSQYYRIERFSFNKKMHLDFSADDRTYIDIDIDFAAFDQAVIETLLATETWTTQIICETIFRTLAEHWGSYPIDPAAVKGYVTAENNRSQTLTKFREMLPDGKLIYCVRSPEGIIATRAHRKPVEEDFRTAANNVQTPLGLIRSGEVRKIVERTATAKQLAATYPEQVLLLTFEQIIEEVEPTMQRVAEFLSVPFVESMTVFSHLGKEVRTGDGKAYVGKVHDVAERMLSRDELRLIELEKDRSGWWNPRKWPSLGMVSMGLKLMCGGKDKPAAKGWQPGSGPPPG